MSQAAATAAKKEKVKPNLAFLRDKHKEPVKGIFKFYEVPGGCMSFVFREFKGEKSQRYDMADGEVYTIPYGVAKHLNTRGWYPEYNFVAGDNSVQTGAAVKGSFANNNVQRVTRKVRRFGFQSLEFTDLEDMPSQVSPIITVESV